MEWQKHNHAFKVQCHSKLGNEEVEDGLGSWIMNELLNISYRQNESNCRNYYLKHIQGPHSFSFFELKTFLKTFFSTLRTYCKKFAIFLRKLKIH